ncbi:MAG TPA: FAD-dependent oxidoreductase [Nocardia sp.]|uniref:NAD(P)/FAD-dependent oxidoreductase n=1 Tax=Nocardia TaxID=1817 RepID=UPI0024589584|nr:MULTISPECIES: FAD-dependent oxidoreductase [Nocardia]HLS77883.1 FAD-dependent oxidoreductase [Nocardia sp.]
MTGQQHRIVVLGAGYAGLAAARKLGRVRGARVTVVDAKAEFAERVRLHQRVAGQQVRRWDLAAAVGRFGAEFLRARVVDLDPTARTVRLRAVEDGAAVPETIGYDTLVYALGSIAANRVPGVAEYARSVATPEDARWVVGADGPVAVVGAGATGIELAAELAESRPGTPVLLLGADEPAAWLGEKAVAHVRRVLTGLGVEVRRGAKVVEVTPDGPRLADGTVVPAAVTVWTTGFAVPDLAARAGLDVDSTGRVRTDPYLRSTSHPEILAVGDSAVMAGPGGCELRMACATALPAGAHAASVIAAGLRGRDPKPLNFRFHLQCLSLGRRDGLIHGLRADDRPAGWMLRGRPAAAVKELIVRGAAGMAGLR